MIAELIPYGGPIYWVLLFFFCIATTLSAEKRNSVLVPSLWGIATLTYVFGFTSYNPPEGVFILGVVAYLIVGIAFGLLRWADLVYRIKTFISTLSGSITNDYELRHMAHKSFEPMDAEDVMTLPPDPYEFRTRIACWILFWPSFTVFRCFAHLSRWLNRNIWSFLYKISKGLYER